MMLFWLLFALMTGAAAFAVLWPLAFSRVAAPAGAEADLAVYRDQLAEIERDQARNLIGEAEAEAARIEVSRRILATANKKPEKNREQSALIRRRVIALVAMIAVPLVALGVYGGTGSPYLPDAPLAERAAKASAQADVMILVRRVEAHLEKNPEDGRGWELLAPVYLMSGRFEEAVKAQRNVQRLLGVTPQRDAALGEALTAEAGGKVTPEAKEAFARAVAGDAKNSKARFFLGFAAEQDGDRATALKYWRALAAEPVSNDPWRNEAVRRMQELDKKP
jgi:cytochrome c-type biogenesis protein CcmH